MSVISTAASGEKQPKLNTWCSSRVAKLIYICFLNRGICIHETVKAFHFFLRLYKDVAYIILRIR